MLTPERIPKGIDARLNAGCLKQRTVCSNPYDPSVRNVRVSNPSRCCLKTALIFAPFTRTSVTDV